MEIQSVPAFWLDMPVWARDAASRPCEPGQKPFFLTVITCTACLWLFQFRWAVWLSLSPKHCTLSSYYSWLFCRFSFETAGKGAQALMAPGDSVASPGIPLGMHSGPWVSRSSHSMMCESELGKKQARTLRLPFSHSSLFLITRGLPRIYQFPSNDLHFISQLYYTKTWNMKGLLL